MKQGTEFVYVKFSLALVQGMKGEWSQPVQVQLQEEYNGDLTLITRNLKDQTLRQLKESL